MSQELSYLGRLVARGRLDRRAFLGRAAALGVGATLANTMLASAVRAEGPVKGGTLRAGMQGDTSADSLDPGSWTSQVQYSLGRTWAEQLVDLSPEGELLPRLATEWDASDDARQWTFRIREGVEFHDGRTLTADDVTATLRRHSDEDSRSGALGVMRGIESVQTDGDTVVITTTEANADLPYLMTDYHLMIQPGGGVDNPTEGVGTGPYRVVEFDPGVRHRAVRFENHWNLDEYGHADEIEITVINDATARTAALQSGQVDIINRVEPRIVDLIARVPGVTINNVAGRGHYVFIMHCNTAPFDNNDLRLALKYAMNREQMLDVILRGYGQIGNDMPINAAYPLFDDTIPQREFDLDRARHHFERSGHEGPILLRTSDVAFPGAVDAAQLYAEACAQAGMQIEIRREPGDGYWSEVWNVQPFSTSYWGGRPTQDQMYSTAYLSTAEWNDTRFHNERFDNLLLEARGELDQDRRKEMYREMGMMVRDEGGLICPMFNDFIDASGSRVQGWVPDPNGEMMAGYALSKVWLSA